MPALSEKIPQTSCLSFGQVHLVPIAGGQANRFTQRNLAAIVQKCSTWRPMHLAKAVFKSHFQLKQIGLSNTLNYECLSLVVMVASRWGGSQYTPVSLGCLGKLRPTWRDWGLLPNKSLPHTILLMNSCPLNCSPLTSCSSKTYFLMFEKRGSACF